MTLLQQIHQPVALDFHANVQEMKIYYKVNKVQNTEKNISFNHWCSQKL